MKLGKARWIGKAQAEPERLRRALRFALAASQNVMTPHDQHFKALIRTFFFEFLAAFAPQIARTLDRRRLEFLDKELGSARSTMKWCR